MALVPTVLLLEGKASYTGVRILGIIGFFINQDLTVGTANNKTFHVGSEAVNIKAFNWVFLMKDELETAVSFADDNVALICAHKDLVVG
jgi:hypothetical protein